MKEIFRKKNTIVIPLLISVIIFLYVCGPRCLNPTNIDWLFEGDSAQHYLGWAFFKNSPWSFPLGLNPDWGIENSSSIIYADALPIFSLLFKCFYPFLPDTFQFYGIWFLTCFILQAFFSWRLLSLFKVNLFLKTFGTLIFTLSPIIFLRLGGHQSLTAHFLILWCFCLYYGHISIRNSIEWIVCLSLSLACHPYFSFMCLVIFGAYVVKEFLNERTIQTFWKLLVLCLLCFTSIFFTAWQIGLFVSTAQPSAVSGYGHFKFNLNGFLNPLGQSFFLKTLPHGAGDYEGFAYLGLGLILLLFVVLILDGSNGFKQTKKIINRSLPLCVSLFFLFLLAVSNNVSFGNWNINLFSIKGGSFIQTFRAAGRFIWPIWYFLCLYAFVLMQQLINERIISFKFSAILIIILSSIQIMDFNDFIHDQIRHQLMTNNSNKWGAQSKDWIILRKKYNEIRLLNNPGLSYPKWRELSLIAVNNKMKTNVSYLARGDSNVLKERMKIDELLLRDCNFNKNIIYVITDKNIIDLGKCLKEPQIIKKIDGFNLLLPNGF